MIRKIFALLLVSVYLVAFAACGGGNDNATPSATQAESTHTFTIGPRDSSAPTGRPADSTFVFEVDEVRLGADGYVKLRNFSDVKASLGGLFLCQSDCFALPNESVGAGDSVVIAAGNASPDSDVLAVWPDLELQPADGEIGVYTSTDPTDSNAVRSYLQWGSTPHPGTDAAIASGLWVPGFAPSSPDAKRLFKTEAGLWVFE